MSLGDTFEAVAGVTPGLCEADPTAAAPDASSRDDRRALAERGCADQVHAAALVTEQVRNRSGERQRDCEHEATVAGRRASHPVDPLVERAGLLVAGDIHASVRNHALAGHAPNSGLRQHEDVVVPTAAPDQANTCAASQATKCLF